MLKVVGYAYAIKAHHFFGLMVLAPIVEGLIVNGLFFEKAFSGMLYLLLFGIYLFWPLAVRSGMLSEQWKCPLDKAFWLRISFIPFIFLMLFLDFLGLDIKNSYVNTLYSYIGGILLFASFFIFPALMFELFEKTGSLGKIDAVVTALMLFVVLPFGMFFIPAKLREYRLKKGWDPNPPWSRP